MPSDFGLHLDWARGAAPARDLTVADLDRPVQVGPWQARLSLDGAHPVVCRALDVVALLHGHLYGTAPEALPALYRRYGAGLGAHLDGAYVLLILDLRLGTVSAFTDRAGTHKLYAAHGGEQIMVATRADWAGFQPRGLDPAGVAAYLATGNMFGGLTLHQGVRALPRASVTQFGRRGPDTHEYWSVPPGPLAGGVTADLTRELAELLHAAVARCLEGVPGRPYLSLSGGYDSRGLLSLLSAGGREVQTFSYAHGAQSRGTDPGVAARLAGQYGARHTVFGAYQGSVLDTVRRNAQWGQGVTHFCDEVDAWAQLETLHPGDIFTGEQPFELCTHALKTVPEQLKNHHLTGFGPLAWLRGLVPDRAYANLEGAWQAELDVITARTLRWEHPAQRDLMLMLDQHLPHVLLPWRERFTGRSARVHTPFLDTPVLDFLARVPLGALSDKALFKAALRHLDPQLLRVPIAGGQGYEPDWHGELIRQRDEVLRAVDAQPSRVDDLLGPGVLRTVLEGLAPVSPQARARSGLRTHLGRIRRTPLGTKVLGVPGLKIGTVDPATFLMRVLTLREADQIVLSRPLAARQAPLNSPEPVYTPAYQRSAGN